MTVRVSILLPFRNAAATLPDCLDSIAAQSFTDYELLAVDDGSDDGSAELIRRRARSDSRIRHLASPGHGLVAALEYGLSLAAGDLVARMDADDLMRRERLGLQQTHLSANPHLTLLGSRVEHLSHAPPGEGLREYLRWQNGCLTPTQIADDIYLESPLAHPSVMFRRSRVMAAGGYREGDFPEDYELWLRLHQRGEPMAKLPQVLLDWRDLPERSSRVDPRCSRGAFDRLRARYLAQDPRVAAARELVIWGAGRKTRRRVEVLLDHGVRPRAWIDIDPRKIGNRYWGAPVEAPHWLEREPRPLVLCYVANHGARLLIERQLGAYGYRKGADFLQVG